MLVYRVTKVYIDKGHALYDWCDKVTLLANNLSNACRYRQRQLITSVRKEDKDLTDNEKEVIGEFLSALKLDDRSSLPVCPGYTKMEAVMKATSNPDYYAEGLPRQSAQHILQRTSQDISNFYDSLRAWKANGSPEGKKPELPGYKHKGGHAAVVITNQDCVLKMDRKGMILAALPFAKKTPLKIGHPQGRLKQAEVVPDNGKYLICFTFMCDLPDPHRDAEPVRIAAVDLGVDNLMAVTNNCGAPCLLYKGGIVKSLNQRYNKRLAAIMQEEMSKPDCPKNREGKPRFVPTEESKRITLYRNNAIQDFMHKTAKHFIAWCVENRIDTVVVGVNAGFKQNVELGKVNNQNFVQIPFAYLRHCISYLCGEHGILYLEREESYTSKASFPDNDEIPVYGINDKDASFSGRRRPESYKGMHRDGGFRGLYRTADGTILNADLNGSANILRKAFPDAFQKGQMPDFGNVVVIRYPDAGKAAENHSRQMQQPKAVSKSKQKRLRRKAS